ncbi:MAG: PEP-CTERM sorting domain-containing protein [Armatimonadetes bacterium]|nr:PEP-CTERM sorting domain-containing protein [Armatimonadota bacterium]
MKGLRLWLMAGVASATLMLLSLSPASALQYWFARAGDPSGTPISQLQILPGQSFSLSVWIQHSPEKLQGIEAILGYDRANAMGTGATPLDQKIVLDGAPAAAVTPKLTVLGSPLLFVGGARGTGTRPYGLRYVLLSVTERADVSTGKELFEVKLKENGRMNVGDTYKLYLWDFGSGASWTALATLEGGRTIRSTGTVELNLVVVPEPGSLIALATGVAGLAGMALRRRA